LPHKKVKHRRVHHTTPSTTAPPHSQS
jgi:hypothetical protein